MMATVAAPPAPMGLAASLHNGASNDIKRPTDSMPPPTRTWVSGPQQKAMHSLREWQRFIRQCRQKRLDLDKFEQYVPLLQSKHPLPPAVIADLFLRPPPKSSDYIDPRTPRYVMILLQLRCVDTPGLLRALYRYSSSHAQSRSTEAVATESAWAARMGQEKEGELNTSKKPLLRWGSSYGHEETIFYRLAKGVNRGTGLRSAKDAAEVAKIMVKWIALFTASSAAFAADVMGQLQGQQAMKGPVQAQAQTEMESARAGFVALLLGFCENQVVLGTLGKAFAKDLRKMLSQSLASFIPSITISSSQPILTRLELFRTETLAGFEPVDKLKEAENAELDDILDSTMGLQNVVIPEIPVTNSRAGLYIYLNAALVGRPLLDDAALYSYLHNRYQGDIQTTAIDLILASFDVLANAVFRNEGQKFAHLLRSYLINKLPLLLASFRASPVYPFDPQACISEALGRIDTNAFPTLSSMFDETQNNNTFTDSVRQDFCFACCLHGLVAETSIENLLGEITYQTLPAGGRYVKEALVEQCMADTEKIQALIAEIDNMDGNVGAVCQSLTLVLGQLCASKDTMTLKTMCSQLARKPLSLDVMLLFDKPATILHPLCELLDNWKYDEDQGEYQPIYEEFSSVLLLLLAFVHRYNLSASELGIRSPTSFVAKLLTKGHLHRSFDELTDQEKDQLGGWIRGLFYNDGGGLGDDLMSSCPPQDFYMLIPTLFHQIVIGFTSGRLTEDSLKSGVEYLVDTFLLPSLVTAILFLSDALWVDAANTQKSIIRILHLILQPTSISTEASSLLSAVLNMVAKPLEHSLRTFQRSDPKSQEVEPLLRALKDNIALSRRTGAADHNELEAWTATAGGGLGGAFKQTVQNFVSWSLHPGVNVMPTSYTHRQFLAALKLLGAPMVLDMILAEIKHQSANDPAGPAASIAYDVACALVCAPSAADQATVPPVGLLDNGPAAGIPQPVQRRIGLRDALKARAEEWKKIQRKDAAKAEAVVRLYRRVEAQMVPALAVLDQGVVDGAGEAALAGALEAAAAAGGGLDGVGLGDAIANAAGDMAAEVEGMGDGGLSLDTGMDLGGDLGMGSVTGSAGGLDLGDNDIFHGLGDLGDWGSMDLS